MIYLSISKLSKVPQYRCSFYHCVYISRCGKQWRNFGNGGFRYLIVLSCSADGTIFWVTRLHIAMKSFRFWWKKNNHGIASDSRVQFLLFTHPAGIYSGGEMFKPNTLYIYWRAYLLNVPFAMSFFPLRTDLLFSAKYGAWWQWE